MKNNNMKTSVVIPAYNAEDFINEQIEALLNNSLLPDEIIVSDNGSTDQTRNIVQSWGRKNSLVRCVDSSARRGVSYARNVGCSAAQGDSLLICDADDIVSSDWVEKIVEALNDSDMVGAGYQTLLLNEELGCYQLDEINVSQPHVVEGTPYLLGGNIGFKRTVMDTIGGFDSSYQGGHDEVDFCLRAIRAGFKLGWIAEPLLQYRQRPSARALARQSRNYGRTWVQLLENFSPEYAHHIPSLKLMLRRVLVSLPSYLRAKDKSWADIRAFWWNVGRLEGVFKYRILKKLPQREIK